MSARIDHVAEAASYIARAENPNAGKTLTCAGLAQAHATLALVEQQRIANMQAERDELRRAAQGRTDATAGDMAARANVLTIHIREGLGCECNDS